MSVFTNIASVFKTNIFVLVLTVISIVIIARTLGPESRGLLAAILVYPQLVIALTEGGMRQSTVYYIGQGRISDPEIAGALFGYILFASFFGIATSICLVYFLADEEMNFLMAIVASTIIPTTLVVNALKGVFLGKYKIELFNRVIWVQKVFYLSCILLLWYLNALTVMSVILITSLSAMFNFILSLKILKSIDFWSYSYKKEVLVLMLQKGILYAVALFLIQANYRIDVLLLSWLSISSEIGYYIVAVQIGELVWQLPAAVLIVLMSMSANYNDSEVVPHVCRASRITFLISTFFCIGLVVVATWLIVPIFGDEYKPAVVILYILAPGLVAMGLFKTINGYFAGKGMPQFSIYIMGGAVFLNVFLNIILIPKYQAAGAAVASTASYLISAVISVIAFSKIASVAVKEIVIVNMEDLEKIYKSLRSRLTKWRIFN